MTSPYEGFKAETKALVENGNNRLEDALACEAARLFLAEVGSVPRAAFGEIDDLSSRTAENWNAQFSARCAELASIRDALWNAGSCLLRVAGEYEDTDVEAAFIIGDTWAIESTPVGGFLGPLMEHFAGVAYRPGEPFPTDFASAQAADALTGGDTLAFPQHIGGEVLPTYSQEVTIETQVLENSLPWEGERHWPWEGEFWEHQGQATIDVPKVKVTASPGAENDELVAFVGREEHGSALALSEVIIDLESGAAGRPMRDMIVPVWTASPTLFARRYEVLKDFSSFVSGILDRVKNQTGRLRTYWEGSGASAYLATDGSGLATMMIDYLAGLVARIDWFIARCRLVEYTFRDLRNGYATNALTDVQSANAANNEYIAALTSTLSSTSPDRVATALNGVYSSYLATRTRELEQIEIALAQEKEGTAGARGLGLDENYTVPRPFQGPGGGDVWADPSLWTTKPGPLPGYEPE